MQSHSVAPGVQAVLRAGACDVRKRIPYGVYDKVDFQEIVYTEGDCFARYLVRMDEIMESLKIIEQLIDNIPEGPYQEKMKPIIRVPEGSYYAAVEGSRGEFGVFLESQGDKMPYPPALSCYGIATCCCNRHDLPRSENCPT